MTTHEKNVVMAVFGALIEKSYAELNTFLGSVTIREMVSMYHRLQYEDYCKRYGKDYDDMTSDDWARLYEMIIAEAEAQSYIDWEEREEWED